MAKRHLKFSNREHGSRPARKMNCKASAKTVLKLGKSCHSTNQMGMKHDDQKSSKAGSFFGNSWCQSGFRAQKNWGMEANHVGASRPTTTNADSSRLQHLHSEPWFGSWLEDRSVYLFSTWKVCILCISICFWEHWHIVRVCDWDSRSDWFSKTPSHFLSKHNMDTLKVVDCHLTTQAVVF